MRFLNHIAIIATYALCSFSYSAFANQNSAHPLNLKPYYASKCNSYTGHWQGFFSDPADLYGNGGPWPIEATVTKNGAELTFNFNANKAPKYVSQKATQIKTLTCQNGQLPLNTDSTEITGALVSRHVMILQIPAGSSMAHTQFIIILQKQK